MRALLIALSVLVLSACSGAKIATGTGTAYIDLPVLLQVHPLYGTLAQYDREIAALQKTISPPGFTHASEAMNEDVTAINQTVSASSKQLQSFSGAKAAGLAKREDNAIAALPSTQAATGPAPNAIAGSIAQTYADQSAQQRQVSASQLQHFRQNLSAQEQAAYAAFARSIDARSRLAYDQRSQELHEQESALNLRLAERDANQRLNLQLKLRGLALDSTTRKAYQAQVAALDRSENSSLQTKRYRDAQTLAAYAAQLRSQAASDKAAMAAELEARTVANFSERRQVAPQPAQVSIPNVQLPSSQPLALQNQIAHLRAGGENRFSDEATAIDSNFSRARGDLSAVLAGPRQANAAATADIQRQIAALQQAKIALQNAMVSQILRKAQTIAQARGFASVSTAQPAAGEPNITAPVRAAILALAP